MNHVMSGRSLRELRADETRDAIVTAFLELAHETNAVTIAMPAVAERAGVSIRTLYRYFATKDDLQSAAATRFSERARRSEGIDRLDRSTFSQYLEALWVDFARDVPAVTAEHCTPAGRRLRDTRLDDGRRLLRASLPPDLDDERLDLVLAVVSSSMFLELVARMGHQPERAAAMAHWAAELILAHRGEPVPDDHRPTSIPAEHPGAP
jgi:AcrR family transcriptional regulator